MMKKKKWLNRSITAGLLMVMFAPHGDAQTHGGLYFGFAPLRAVMAGYELPSDAEKISFGLESCYLIALNHGAYYRTSSIEDITVVPSRELNSQGIMLRPVMAVHFSERNGMLIIPEFGYLWSNKFIIDDGKFSGSDDTYYAEFKQTYRTAGIHMMYSLRFGYKKMFCFFGGAGLRYNDTERKYSIEGHFTQQLPSDRKEKLGTFTGSLDVGFRFYIPGTAQKTAGTVK